MCIMDFFSNKTVTPILSDKSALTLSVYMNVFFFFYSYDNCKTKKCIFSAYLHVAMLKGKNREKTNMLIFLKNYRVGEALFPLRCIQ